RLAASLLRSAARENLDLAPLNLRFSRLHLTKNMLAIRPTHLIRASLTAGKRPAGSLVTSSNICLLLS
ncbi:MAG: hypothetical protein IJU12_01745, partial [Clostridia bacterium]|nr:hypothetical protein [Clostridia bacterium]